MDTVKVGDVVLVSVDPALNNGLPVAPAIVVRAWSMSIVNLRVLTDSSNPPLWFPSATFASSVDDLAAGPAGRYWTWRP